MRAATGCLGDAGGLRGQRPSLRKKQTWIGDFVEIDVTRPRAADVDACVEGPPIRPAHESGMIDQRQVGAAGTREKPDPSVTSLAPVLHRREPFLLRPNRQQL